LVGVGGGGGGGLRWGRGGGGFGGGGLGCAREVVYRRGGRTVWCGDGGSWTNSVEKQQPGREATQQRSGTDCFAWLTTKHPSEGGAKAQSTPHAHNMLVMSEQRSASVMGSFSEKPPRPRRRPGPCTPAEQARRGVRRRRPTKRSGGHPAAGPGAHWELESRGRPPGRSDARPRLRLSQTARLRFLHRRQWLQRARRPQPWISRAGFSRRVG